MKYVTINGVDGYLQWFIYPGLHYCDSYEEAQQMVSDLRKEGAILGQVEIFCQFCPDYLDDD